MLRIIIVAEHASAKFGGEAALPLHYFRVLRELGHRVWLITHARTRSELSGVFPGEDRIVYIEDSCFHRFMHALSRVLPARLSHFTVGFASRLSVQLAQRARIRRILGQEAIDVIHQPMPVSPREPSMMYGFGVPVVIGPMNGGMDYPPAFRRARKFESASIRIARAAADGFNVLMPGKLRAAILLVANARTRRALPSRARARVVELVENGIDLGVWRPAPVQAVAIHHDRVTKFVYMGRLVDWKRVDLLLEAFARAAPHAPMTLTVIGSGPEEERLKRLAASLNILAAANSPTGVTFVGWLEQSDCAERLRGSDCLVLPSILECGGAVVLEAMAMAKPVIATAWGGPLDYLDEDCGVLVAPSGPDALTDGLSAAMRRICAAPDERERMGQAGRAKVLREYDWSRKAARICEIYAEAIGSDR